MNFKLCMKELAKQMQIEINDDCLNKFEIYSKTLQEWNMKMNLTSINDTYEIIVKHFLDSLTLLSIDELKKNSKMIDIGTGAGFPGIPLKIIRDDLDVTLMDSTKKKLDFIEHILRTLNLNAKTIHERAEIGAKKLDLKEKFDFVTARALAPMPKLAEYCMPYTKVSGVFVAMKGPGANNEIKNASEAIKELGGEVKQIKNIEMANNIKRVIVVIKKIKRTSNKYPRKPQIISKQPI